METSNDVKYARYTVIFHLYIILYIVIFPSQLTVLSASTFYDVIFV
jgi:hypothetical protein